MDFLDKATNIYVSPRVEPSFPHSNHLYVSMPSAHISLDDARALRAKLDEVIEAEATRPVRVTVEMPANLVEVWLMHNGSYFPEVKVSDS